MHSSWLIESFSDFAVYELSPSGEVRTWNEAATKLLGFSAEEIIGRSVTNLTEQSVEESTFFFCVSAKNGWAETFGWLARKDGSRVWACEVTTPLRDDAGKIIGFARIVRDLTAWKTAAVIRSI